MEIAVRWERRQWVAYSIGETPKYASHQNWSTSLGDIEVEEIETFFRSANLTFMPPLEK
jgi:hypothetical protein